LLEVLFASAILAFVVATAFAAIIQAVRASEENTLRASALHTAERTIEELRAVGAKQLKALLTYDALAAQGFQGVWGGDGVALGLTPRELTMAKSYLLSSAEARWRELVSRRKNLRQAVLLVTLGDHEEMEEDVVRVYVDLEWTVANRSFHESLFAVID